jgi:2-amino-4-hydroxy-6-hydroxymethyldihydropteridine diphosphokinase
MTQAIVGIGGNIGDRMTYLRRMIRALDDIECVRVLAVSRAYETEPWGVPGQDTYYNAAVRIETSLTADELLMTCKDIERALGREKTVRFGPRTADLDILLFGDEAIATERLTVPHPRLLEREFAVRPLLDVVGDLTLPDGSPVTDEQVRVGRVVADLGPMENPAGPQVWIEQGEIQFMRAPFKTLEVDENQVIGDWVAVGPPHAEPGGAATPGRDLDLLWLEEVMKDAEIPTEFYPNRPGESLAPYPGLASAARLFVPRDRLADAHRALDEAVGDDPDVT